MTSPIHCLVLGAGVSGLSCAKRLQQAGHRVDVWTRDRPRDTTSAIAAAIWYPYRAAPMNRVTRWGAATFAELERLSRHHDTGVTMCSGVEVFRTRVSDPAWAGTVPGFRRATRNELPDDAVDGYHLRVPVADMTRYLVWLEATAQHAGTKIQTHAVLTLGDVVGAADVIVNCTGLGARTVANDRTLYGVRGQVQVVAAPAVDTFVIADEPGATTYIVPRGTSVVLGGTADEYDETTHVDKATAEAIRARCTRLAPALNEAPTLGNKVGIRPCRPQVRLEAESIDGQRVIHNYGHGGAGVTLSWGCADEVVQLVESGSADQNRAG